LLLVGSLGAMRALVSRPDPPYAESAVVSDPDPDRDRALVEVRAFSLNRGETRRLASIEPGSVTGWDVAGIVPAPAGDGTGPRQGARVVGLAQAGWAELAAASTDRLAEIPDRVGFEQAAALPVAGMTALRALEAGFLLGKRALVTGASGGVGRTGASGGVGRFAIQLAKLAGANVTAPAQRTQGLSELGADDVIQVLEPEGPTYNVIIDAAGGPTLGAAIGRIAPSRTIVNFAATSDEPVSYPTRTLFGRAPGARLYGLLPVQRTRQTQQRQ
jgi:NADPH:quinone reductase